MERMDKSRTLKDGWGFSKLLGDVKYLAKIAQGNS
jgi:hypothetical protein